MAAIGDLANRGRRALLDGDAELLGELMRENLELRRRVFELEPEHLRMADAAAELGMPANYAGSGGAIVALAGNGAPDELERRLGRGCTVIEPRVPAGVTDVL
jgi:mevalonate kinase